MNADGIWRLFCETGNLNCYLLYKTQERADGKERRTPSPDDGEKPTDTGSARM
jgi:hypothetical protein